jgi:hypothetical protein
LGLHRLAGWAKGTITNPLDGYTPSLVGNALAGERTHSGAITLPATISLDLPFASPGKKGEGKERTGKR